MLSYGTVGTNKLEEAKGFYDKLLGLMDMLPIMDDPERGKLYASPDGGMFGVMRPWDGKPVAVGNGSMHGFALKSREKVDEFHKLALELGGTCEGEPGPRGPKDMELYFTYVRDLDGNKLCAFKVGTD